MEAQASGLPTVVSDTGGPKELVSEGVNGAVTRSLDVDDFTRAVRELVVDAPLRQKLGGQARQCVQNRDWARAFRTFWDISPQ